MPSFSIPPLGTQLVWLFLLAAPVACITWTITQEEIFREPREFCLARSRDSRTLYQRKFFFALTCEYCVSHYVAAGIIFVTGYRLLLGSWRGYVIAGFSLVWVANFYMTVFRRLRLEVKSQKLEADQVERRLSPQKLGRPETKAPHYRSS